MAEFGEVVGPWWNDKPVIIVAGGPSLINFDFQRLRGAHVLAVKGSIFDIPWADAGFGLDWPRFEEWKDKLAGLSMRIYWGIEESRLPQCPVADNLTYLLRKVADDNDELSSNPGEIYVGGTSGFGALQIALMKRATKIILLGYDYNGDYRPGGQFRHNQAHYERKRRQDKATWQVWASYFNNVEWKIRTRGVELINACPSSAITAFRKVTIQDGLREAGVL